MSCGTNLTADAVAQLIEHAILKMIECGRIQGPLRACGDSECDSLPPMSRVVLCSQLVDLVNEGIEDGSIRIPDPIIDFELVGTQLHLTDRTGKVWPVELQPILDKFLVDGVLTADFQLRLYREDGTYIDIDMTPLMSQELVTEDTLTLELVGVGTDDAPLRGIVRVSSAAGQVLRIDPEGLFVQNVQFAWDNNTNVLSLTDNLGNTELVNLNKFLTSVAVTESDTVYLSGNGTAADPIKADARISGDAHNSLEARPTGLFAHDYGLNYNAPDWTLTFIDKSGSPVTLDFSDFITGVVTADNAGIHMVGDGTAGSPLEGLVQISADAQNATTLEDDGLRTLNAGLSWNNSTKIITFRDNRGQNTAIDLSQFVADIYINGGNFDPATGILTLTPNDPALPPVTVDLGALAKSVTQNTTTVTLSGDGSAGSPLTATARVATTAGNRITVQSTGLYAAPELPGGRSPGWVLGLDANNNPIWRAETPVPAATVTVQSTATVAMSGDGSSTTPIRSNVRISTITGNRLASDAAGVYVLPELPANRNQNDLLSVDANGNPIWVARSVTHTHVQGSNTATVTGTGAQATPYVVATRIAATAGNRAQATTAGVFVPPELPPQRVNGQVLKIVNGAPTWVDDVAPEDECLFEVFPTDVSGFFNVTVALNNMVINARGASLRFLTGDIADMPEGWHATIVNTSAGPRNVNGIIPVGAQIPARGAITVIKIGSSVFGFGALQ